MVGPSNPPPQTFIYFHGLWQTNPTCQGPQQNAVISSTWVHSARIAEQWRRNFPLRCECCSSSPLPPPSAMCFFATILVPKMLLLLALRLFLVFLSLKIIADEVTGRGGWESQAAEADWFPLFLGQKLCSISRNRGLPLAPN